MRGYLRTALLIPVLFLAASAAATACAGGGPADDSSGPGLPGAPGSPGSGGALPAGRTFVATAVTADGAPKQLVAGTRIELRFAADGKLGAQAGCNLMGGVARLDRGRLIVEDLSTTEMGCDQARHDQDKWLGDLLQSGPEWKLSGDELVLTGGGTELRLKDRTAVEPALPLTGPKWMVDTLVKGEVAGSVPAGTEAYVVFGTDGSAKGSTGCNVFGGKATVEGNKITMSELVTTKKACDQPVAALESAVLRVFEKPVTYKIEGNRLTLTGPDGTGLVLTAAA